MGFTTFALFFSLLLTISTAATFTNITQTQPLKHTDFLTSKTFTLGFFTPINSTSSYIAIWYSNIPSQTIVWVANRRRPIPIGSISTTTLKLNNNNSLILSDSNDTVYWSSAQNDVVQRPSNSTIAVLTDAGNLIVSSIQSGRKIWQSFDHPTY